MSGKSATKPMKPSRPLLLKRRTIAASARRIGTFRIRSRDHRPSQRKAGPIRGSRTSAKSERIRCSNCRRSRVDRGRASQHGQATALPPRPAGYSRPFGPDRSSCWADAAMADPTGESSGGALRLDFDRRLMLQFCAGAITAGALRTAGDQPCWQSQMGTNLPFNTGSSRECRLRLGGRYS